MQTILLVSVVCVASGFTLEMPELPDLIGTVGKVFGGNFTLKMVEEPKVFLPKVSQIESMTREESMERFHWFFCVYVLIFLGVTFVGSVIMVVGPILKSRAFASSDSAESSELPLKTNGSWRVAQDFCSRTTSATPGHGTAVSDAVLIEPKLRQTAARPWI